MVEPKYPGIVVELVGQDGNAFAILGRVTKALRRANVPEGMVKAFYAEATSGNYDHLLQTVMEWVSVDMPDEDEDDWNGEWEYASEEG